MKKFFRSKFGSFLFSIICIILFTGVLLSNPDLYDAMLHMNEDQNVNFAVVGAYLTAIVFAFGELLYSVFDLLIDLIRRIIHKRNNRHAPPSDPEHR